MRMRRTSVITAVQVLLACAVCSPVASAQYFGQNKVQYERFDFQVLTTPHFEIYYYPEEAEAVERAARMAERWHARLSRLLEHELRGTQRVVLYASSSHFQQTNVIEGMIGEGTGGVTESIRRRVVLPFAGGLAETDHVLGHELVHAYQYDMLGVTALPLWFIEGMAEYYSLGATDAQTAVWMRDAAEAERLPTLDQLDHPDYFPYRFGHAFWAYVAQRYGDDAILDILSALAPAPGERGARGDPIEAIEFVLGADRKTISAEWHQSVLDTMLRPLGERPALAGQTLITPTSDNEINVGPVLSPDGSRLAFLTSRNRLSIDLVVADARTGKIQRRLTKTAADPHFDSLQFIESAGAWDPGGRQIAITAVRTGRPVLVIFDATSGDRVREIPLPDLDEAFQPAWSPDGQQIALSGMQGGLLDLYMLTLSSGAIRRLTNDEFAEAQPAFSPDGRSLLYATDRYSSDPAQLAFGPSELATIDLATGATSHLRTFPGAMHGSPQWSPGAIYFVADPDGIPDVYRLDTASGRIRRLTQSTTGVIGITATTPALSIARDAAQGAFVLYRRGSYEIRALTGTALGSGVPPPPATTRAAARLAPATPAPTAVDRALAASSLGLPLEPFRDTRPYRPQLGLDYIGQSYGVAVGGFGPYMAGGVGMQFSDMLGNHIVTGVFQLNGRIEDFGGLVGYLNRSSRWNWGAYLQQVPYVSAFFASGVANVNGSPALVDQELRERQVDRQLLGLVQYPFSRPSRIEFAGGVRHLTFDTEIRTLAYDPVTGELLLDQTEERQLADPLTLGQASVALVRDTAVFGATGPILGGRSRFEVVPTVGDLTFTRVGLDLRHYVMPIRPFTIAGRLLHVGRYGSDSESTRLSPLFLGYPSLVRGYDVDSFSIEDCGPDPNRCESFDNLLGTRLLVAGVELRTPLVGAFKGELDYGGVPVDLIGFFDAGVAWTRDTRPSLFGSGDRPWARSVGVGARVNVFGYLVMEFDAVHPLDRVRNGWQFLFNVLSGY